MTGNFLYYIQAVWSEYYSIKYYRDNVENIDM